MEAIRRNTRIGHVLPNLGIVDDYAVHYEDKLSQFCSIMEQVGGKAVVLEKDDDINEVIRSLYPDAKRIASCVEGAVCLGKRQAITLPVFHPDSVDSPADLDGTDLAIVEGKLGVCENGAVWVEQDVENRAVYFISEALVLLVDRHMLVDNMHQAYKLVSTGPWGYGVYISGPSKTADIEQALVMGAHGARSVTVILL